MSFWMAWSFSGYVDSVPLRNGIFLAYAHLKEGLHWESRAVKTVRDRKASIDEMEKKR
ncbi:hypothetical protein KFK09_011592 [Dendrobium nobile]|uniref:Uncharacterized protein n=1 Tax=Dendrobium nobile TaxID=94219 RepID=A0A8T3BDB0_DENNO|nr:hypothetical protein KFK09_011592 [Dendrobium nobile]